MTRACEGCGHSFDERMMFQMVTGWVPVSKRTAIRARRYEQRFACRPCVDAFTKTGQSWEQLSLLEG